MARNLDLTALRSFTAVADAGGVDPRGGAAQPHPVGRLHAAQAPRGPARPRALDRSGRSMALTAQGEQLLAYARRLLALNDEAWGRMTHQAFEGEIDARRAAGHHLPARAAGAAALRPRLPPGEGAAALRPTPSICKPPLRARRDRPDPDHRGGSRPGGETLARSRWSGWAPGRAGLAARPLRFGSTRALRLPAPGARGAGARRLPWELAVDSVSCSAVEVSVAADLAVFVQLASSIPAAAR